MIKVIICDDKPQILSYYQSVLLDTATANDLEVKIVCCESGEQLLLYLEDNPNGVDIIYLDILMGTLDGMETARRLRKMGCTAQLIYLTTSSEYVFESFEVEPFYYIVKDDMPLKKFREIFIKAVETLKNKDDDYITVSTGATTTKINLDRIYYFEVNNRMVTLHSRENDIDFYSTLEDVERTLSQKDFIRVHRSYLVNCHHIKKLLRAQLTLSDGTELPISTKYSQVVQESFSRYLLTM